MLLNSSLELCHGRIVNADQDHVKREVHRFASEGACALELPPCGIRAENCHLRAAPSTASPWRKDNCHDGMLIWLGQNRLPAAQRE